MYFIGENGAETLFLSMDGKELYLSDGHLMLTTNFSYPYVLPFGGYATKDHIIEGYPEDGDEVIYEKNIYTYSSSAGGYTATLRDPTQTFNSNEVLSNIYGVTVINKN